MRRAHLEALRPVCPACRAPGDDAAPLELGAVALGVAGLALGLLLVRRRAAPRAA